MIPLHLADKEPVRLTDEQTLALIEIALPAWKSGVDTYALAKIASFRMGRVIPEYVVANLLADYWLEER